MSYESLAGEIFYGVAKPEYSDAFAQSEVIADWIDEHMPYSQRGEYDYKRAYRMRNAICFAQATGSALVSQEVLDQPAGIMLTNTPRGHALAFGLVAEPSSPLDKVVFYEPEGVATDFIDNSAETYTYRDCHEQQMAIGDHADPEFMEVQSSI